MSPAIARGGASILGVFLIGLSLLKTLMLALLITAALAALVFALKSTGWIHLEWNLIQADVTHTLDWARGKAQGLKEVSTGYLSAFGAGAVGALFGFLRK
jgi:hypothetical protein